MSSHNLQPLLFGGKRYATDLDLVLSEVDNNYCLYLGPALVERISCNEESLAYKCLVGRLYNAGWKMGQLRSIFTHDSRTIQKWADALLSDDPEFIVKTFSGRGARKKTSPEAIRFIKARYLELKNKRSDFRRQISVEVASYFNVLLSRETLRKIFRAADEQSNAQQSISENKIELGNVQNMSITCPQSEIPSSNPFSDDKQSTHFAPIGNIPIGSNKMPKPSIPLHHAGLIFFTTMLELLSRGRQQTGVSMQWLCQILQGAVNIEQSRELSLKDICGFSGMYIPCLQTQRAELKALSSPDKLIEAYAANNRLLTDGPGKSKVFYYDPTTKKYSGMYKTLKGWCGSTHGVGKVMYLDAFHTVSGRPCFLQAFSPYYDMRERFFMSMHLFNHLFPENAKRGRTFIIDRGIFGQECFKRFARAGDYLITWEKNYPGDAWREGDDIIQFSRNKFRNNRHDLKTYSFRCLEMNWQKNPSFRRFIVQATNPSGNTVQLSILCSNPEIELNEAVWLMFSRWIQENNFKYLNQHFGLDQITSYAMKDFSQCERQFQDKCVDSIEYRELKSKWTKVQNQWAKLLLKKERQVEKLLELKKKTVQTRRRLKSYLTKAQDAIDLGITDLRKLKEINSSLAQWGKTLNKQKLSEEKNKLNLIQIDEHSQALAVQCRELENLLERAIRKQSRLTLLIDNHYKFHDTRVKAMFDALRLTAFNMFANLIETFRPLYNNNRNDHKIVRLLTRADGFLKNSQDHTTLTLWLKGHYQKKQLEVIRSFIEIVQQNINIHFGESIKKINIELLLNS